MSKVFIALWFALCITLVSFCVSEFHSTAKAIDIGSEHDAIHKLLDDISEHRIKSEQNKEALNLSLYIIGGLLGLMNGLVGFIYVQGQRTTRDFVKLQVDQLRIVIDERQKFSSINASEICKLWDSMDIIKKDYLSKVDHDRICEAQSDAH